MPSAPRPEPDLAPRRFALGGEGFDVLVPRDPEGLLDEEAFEHEEFLPYWAESWPSGPVLADRLVERDLTGLPVLELGCGLGLPSLLAARLGADVTASDWAPDALALLARNAERNDVELELLRLDWFAPGAAWGDAVTRPAATDAPSPATPTTTTTQVTSATTTTPATPVTSATTTTPATTAPSWPLVVAADVLYERRHVAPLLATLELVVAPGGEAWVADPGRPPARRFWPAAVAAGWTVDVLGDAEAGQPVVRRLRRT